MVCPKCLNENKFKTKIKVETENEKDTKFKMNGTPRCSSHGGSVTMPASYKRLSPRYTPVKLKVKGKYRQLYMDVCLKCGTVVRTYV